MTRQLRPIQLGQDFRRQMDLIWVHYDHRLMGNERLRWWARLLLNITGYCVFNNITDDDKQTDNQEEKGHQARDSRPANKQTLAQYLAPRLVLLVYLINMYLGSQGLVYHYIYDYYNYHNAKLSSALQLAHTQWHLVEEYTKQFNYDINRTQTVLRERVDSSKLDLMACGSPYLHASDSHPFVVECTFLYIAGFGCFIYLEALIYFGHRSARSASHLARTIANPRRERRQLNTMIIGELNKFLASSWNFCHKQLTDRRVTLAQARLDESFLSASGQERVDDGDGDDDEANVVKREIGTYLEDCQALRMMALRGDFKLATSSADWIDKLAAIYLKFNVCTYLLYLVVYLVVSFVFIFLAGFQLRLDLRSNIISLGLGLDVVIILTAGVYFFSLILVMFLEQIELVNHLRHRIDSFIRSHGNQAEVVVGRRANWRQTKRRANDHLLAILLEYKIFIEQLKGHGNLLGYISTIGQGLLFLMPLLARVHAAYLGAQMKALLVILSINHICYVDLFLVPICYLQTRCVALQGTFASLQAHVVHLETENNSASSDFLAPLNRLSNPLNRFHLNYTYCPRPTAAKPRRAPLISPHTSWTLRQEYLNQRRLADQFHADHHFVGFVFTYPNLLRAHFWLGILLISIYFEPEQQHELVGAHDERHEQIITRLFRDPLAIDKLYL